MLGKKKKQDAEPVKKKKRGKKEKEVYIEKKGVMGDGKDYHVYHMTKMDKIIGYLIGAIGTGFACYVFFQMPVFSIIVGLVVGIFSINIYRDHCLKKQKRQLLMQFKDMLESINNSYAAGRNTRDAFLSAYDDMKRQHGSSADIVKEIRIINTGMESGFNVEEMLNDFADRSELDDVRNFADVFEICNRSGGDLKKVVSETYDMIRDKIDIEIDINTTIAGGKTELNIMAALPLLVVFMTNMTMSSDSGGAGILNFIIKIVALAIIAGSYAMGRKMVKIKS